MLTWSGLAIQITGSFEFSCLSATLPIGHFVSSGVINRCWVGCLWVDSFVKINCWFIVFRPAKVPYREYIGWRLTGSRVEEITVLFFNKHCWSAGTNSFRNPPSNKQSSFRNMRLIGWQKRNAFLLFGTAYQSLWISGSHLLLDVSKQDA